jgi:hypothetical protein
MIENIIKWIYRKRAIYGLRRKYLLDIPVDEILKDWITDCIIERKQDGRRKELINAQEGLKEKELFYKWLKTQK